MKEFWHRYSYSAVKLFITQCVFAIFGLTLSIATGKSRPLQIAACIGAVIFYLFMVYSDCFKLGAEDRIRIGGGRETAKPLKGLYIGLAANSPNLLLCLVGMLTLAPEGTVAFRAGTVAHTVHLFLQGAWTGILATRIGDVPMNTMWWAHFAVVAPSLLVAFTAFAFGLSDIRFSKLFIPENPEDREIRKEKQRERDAGRNGGSGNGDGES